MTRFAADLLENAAAEGARQRRSARQQLDHWARVGCAASSRHSAARRKVEAALACELELAELGVEQGAVFNAEISTATWPGPGPTARCWPDADVASEEGDIEGSTVPQFGRRRRLNAGYRSAPDLAGLDTRLAD